MTEPWYHWSAELLWQVRSTPQDPAPDFKPRGLWFSVGDGEDGWRTWCEREDFGARFRHRATLAAVPGARILELRGAADIDDFTAHYRAALTAVPPYEFRQILWAEVATQHDGIVIAPYCWERRLHPGAHWYYTWDCASGCIWNGEAVEIVEQEVWDEDHERHAAG